MGHRSEADMGDVVENQVLDLAKRVRHEAEPSTLRHVAGLSHCARTEEGIRETGRVVEDVGKLRIVRARLVGKKERRELRLVQVLAMACVSARHCRVVDVDPHRPLWAIVPAEGRLAEIERAVDETPPPPRRLISSAL